MERYGLAHCIVACSYRSSLKRLGGAHIVLPPPCSSPQTDPSQFSETMLRVKAVCGMEMGELSAMFLVVEKQEKVCLTRAYIFGNVRDADVDKR